MIDRGEAHVSDNARQYENYISHQLRPLDDRARRNRIDYFIHNYRRHLPVDKDAPILDYGCGRGECIQFLQGQGYRNIDAVDISAEVVEHASRLLPNRVRQVTDPAAFVGEKAGSYDLVTFLEVVEHIPSAEVVDFLSGLKRLLRPGGKAIIETPNGEAPFANAHMYHDATHIRLYTLESLRHVLALAGYKNVAIYGLDIPLTRSGRYVQRLTQRTIHAAVTLLRAMEGALPPTLLTPMFYAVAS